MKSGLAHPDWKHRIHIVIGLVFALYFLMLAVTGVMIHHSAAWGLTERYVSRRYLPSSYRPLDGDETRLDIVITDLHSGRIFGATGRWLPDLIAGLWTVSILTGIGMVLWKKSNTRRKEEPDFADVSPQESPIEEVVHARD